MRDRCSLIVLALFGARNIDSNGLVGPNPSATSQIKDNCANQNIWRFIDSLALAGVTLSSGDSIQN